MNKSNHCSKCNSDNTDQIERGLRIKSIRENELKMNKSQLAREIGISSQFLGLIEDGKGNLVYKSVKKLMNLSGHSSDYILFGLEDNIISEARILLEKYTKEEIDKSLEIIKDIVKLIK